MGEEFKLPASSYEELVKIIIGYGQTQENATLEDVHQYCGVSKTTISRNSKFLLSVKIIEGSKSKKITQKGKKLARALEHDICNEISKLWREIIFENEFMSKMVTAVKIRKGMEPDGFQSHIAYSSGQKDSSRVRTGAKTIIDIFKVANLIEEVDGNLVSKKIDDDELNLKDKQNKNIEGKQNMEEKINVTKQTSGKKISININVNITSKPSELDGLGKKINKIIEEINDINVENN